MAKVNTIDRRTMKLGASYSHSPARQSRSALVFAAIGAFSFWGPDVAIHLDAGPNLDVRHAWSITLIAPAIFLLAYVVVRKFALKHDFKRLGPAMLLGVWLSGGLFMTLAAMASGSEFIGGTGVWRLVVIVISVIPIVTYVLSAYDGSLFALLAVTVGGLLILGFRSSVALWNSAATANNLAIKRPVSKSDEKRAA